MYLFILTLVFQIFYIDYGTSDEVLTEKLRYLHKDFATYPPFCMQAKLWGIQPKNDGNYGPDVNKEFLRLFGNCDLEAEVVDATSKVCISYLGLPSLHLKIVN